MSRQVQKYKYRGFIEVYVHIAVSSCAASCCASLCSAQKGMSKFGILVQLMVPEEQGEKMEKPLRALADRGTFRNHKKLLFGKAGNPKLTCNPQLGFFNAVLRPKPISVCCG